jgi:hypothetical protein
MLIFLRKVFGVAYHNSKPDEMGTVLKGYIIGEIMLTTNQFMRAFVYKETTDPQNEFKIIDILDNVATICLCVATLVIHFKCQRPFLKFLFEGLLIQLSLYLNVELRLQKKTVNYDRIIVR